MYLEDISKYFFHDIKQLLTHFNTIDSRHVYREANRTADYVAALGHLVQIHQDIDSFIDSKFSHFRSLDKLGFSFERRLS